ncbi:hypothetical protein [Bacillus marinisedimentorum]|uniref:hypothetical protein n=1 Tax=Bacillus marinisedimentorum TaxID=1821260 RepID=UPI0008734C68|nr:hypothetical protein [Bacillus marinisedimentorum]
MMFILVFLPFFTFFMYSTKPSRDNPSIGESKVVDGVEYYNIGTLDNEDNWVKVGPTIPQFYVNVCQVDHGYTIKVEKEMNPHAYDYIECYDQREVNLFQKYLKDVYSNRLQFRNENN